MKYCLLILLSVGTLRAQYQDPSKYMGLGKNELIATRLANEPGKATLQPIGQKESDSELSYAIQLKENVIGSEYYIFNDKNICDQIYYSYDLSTWIERVTYFKTAFNFELHGELTTTESQSGIYYFSKTYNMRLLVQFSDRDGQYGKQMLLIFFPNEN